MITPNHIENFTFYKTICDALTCGLMVVDHQGRVAFANDHSKEAFGSEGTTIGKPFGFALGCLIAVDDAETCGLKNGCQTCALRKEALRAIHDQEKRSIHTTLTISSARGKVRDLTLSVKIHPLSIAQNRFALLLVEQHGIAESTPMEQTRSGFNGIIGESRAIKQMIAALRQLAKSDAPVLIQGESGTGKELVAHALHMESLRAPKQFVPVNCGALPEGLLESEVFGHLKGAFTGANSAKKGRFATADGGTLFLDEVGEMSPVQVKFLRVLQNGCFEPVGSDRTICVDVRVISATNADLAKKAQEGRFRQDLYYRLSVMPIIVPPLRARKEDIPLLSEHFLAEFSRSAWSPQSTLAPELLTLLQQYNWPGNVRELRNVLQYAHVRKRSAVITPEDLPPNLQTTLLPGGRYKRKRIAKLNDSRVAEALQMTSGNRLEAARMLGVSRSTLYRFLDEMNAGSF